MNKPFICRSCGCHDFIEKDNYLVCSCCGEKHVIEQEKPGIDLREDVNRLLEKCRSEPNRAKALAQRILEIDPNNTEALRILRDSMPPSQKSACYIATSVYGSYDCPQVWVLRRFRDITLARTWYGRTFISTYYATSPLLLKWFGGKRYFNSICKPILDRAVCRLKDRGFADTPYCDNPESRG